MDSPKLYFYTFARVMQERHMLLSDSLDRKLALDQEFFAAVKSKKLDRIEVARAHLMILIGHDDLFHGGEEKSLLHQIRKLTKSYDFTVKIDNSRRAQYSRDILASMERLASLQKQFESASNAEYLEMREALQLDEYGSLEMKYLLQNYSAVQNDQLGKKFLLSVVDLLDRIKESLIEQYDCLARPTKDAKSQMQEYKIRLTSLSGYFRGLQDLSREVPPFMSTLVTISDNTTRLNEAFQSLVVSDNKYVKSVDSAARATKFTDTYNKAYRIRDILVAAPISMLTVPLILDIPLVTIGVVQGRSINFQALGEFDIQMAFAALTLCLAYLTFQLAFKGILQMRLKLYEMFSSKKKAPRNKAIKVINSIYEDVINTADDVAREYAGLADA